MAETVYKKIELVGTSTESFSAAAASAVEKAKQSVRGMRWFEVTEQRGRLSDNNIVEYQTTIQIGFHLE
jgi:flavin-binding protein dodecin